MESKSNLIHSCKRTQIEERGFLSNDVIWKVGTITNNKIVTKFIQKILIILIIMRYKKLEQFNGWKFVLIIEHSLTQWHFLFQLAIEMIGYGDDSIVALDDIGTFFFLEGILLFL